MSEKCIHYIDLILSPQFKKLVIKNKLSCSSDGKYCDHRIPFTIQDIKGQDIGCVGEEHPDCPKKSQKQKL